MKISDLKLGQKVTIDGLQLEYKGIQKVKIANYVRVEKRVFKGSGINICKYYSLNEGHLLLEDENIRLVESSDNI
jgi:hypothetical protein